MKGGNASRFRVGQLVSYRQGRGAFNAKVIAVDAKTNTVTVKNPSKPARVRPAAKVYAPMKA
jgi:hypothetical protein